MGEPNVGRLPEYSCRSAEGLTLVCGNKFDDCTRAKARAWFSRARAASRLWLALIVCSSNASNSVVLNSDHHVPFGIASLGAAACHGPCRLHCAGICAVGF